MPTFKYDGTEIPFQPGETIIKAAYRLGIEIPHYCWHPGLSAPANCRMCLVEIAPPPNQKALMLDILEWDAAKNDYVPTRKPKLQPACQMAAVEGMDVRGDTSEHVKEARKGVQEFLLLNHPVDCPICDQSGECKLQDYWLEHGQYQKRMRDEPVHKPKAVEFGPTIVYDAERCVMCTRCIRFMDEVAMDPVLDMRERGNLNEIFVAPDRQLDGNYTLMTEHVCPVGALTSKDFRFKARVWFLRTAKTVCQGCATGCSAHLDFDPRNNKAYRYRPRDNEAVNHYWMCDPGMLTYKLAHENRVLEPSVRKDGKAEGRVTSPQKALDAAKKLLASVPRESIALLLSAQHSSEDNWALKELGATLLGSAQFFATGQATGFSDKILIHRDKNPNTKGMVELMPTVKPFADLIDDAKAGRITHVIALGGATPGDQEADIIGLATLKCLVVIAAHEGPLTAAAHVVLPAASWAETSGTYVNYKGVRQVTEKGLVMQGACLPAWQQIAELGRAMGLDASWTKLRHVRERMAPPAPVGNPNPPPNAQPNTPEGGISP
ncbi:MAG: nuoG [Myxococcaceae bacterium]|nr:nuoG [Myxococcaceae bacterium]